VVRVHQDPPLTLGCGSKAEGGIDVEGCLACDLVAGRQPLPGGIIHESSGWRVEHCVGPLGTGTLLLKPIRHVTSVADLSVAEAEALGPLLRRASWIACRLVDAEQVYNCLWSHAGGVRGHIHYVVQPITFQQIERFGLRGPALQTAMFALAEVPDPDRVAVLADRARKLWVEV
jgi:diadenosine tetraphosphate (Ap4A) HIT family hydrolase